MRSDVYATVER